MNNALLGRAFPLVLALTALATVVRSAPPPPRLPDAQRVSALQSLKWGLFFHWSLGTFSGQEWTKGITSADYFAATGADTDGWCAAAKEAGMGYILFVAKHHDGFCLWDTATTEFKVTRSPLGRDVIADLRKSCDKYGLKLALYFSEADWTWPDLKNAEMKRRQLEELCTRYGEIAFFWMDSAQWDGGLDHRDTAELVRKLQPNCFVGFNHGRPAGDLQSREMGSFQPLRPPTARRLTDAQMDELVRENERNVLALDWPAAARQEIAMYEQYDGYRAAECSICINQKDGRWYWFYNPETEDNAIPAAKIASLYRDATANGVLLSIATGPDRSGRLRAVDVQRLKEVTRLLKQEQAGP